MDLIDEVLGYAQANAKAATGHDRETWEAHARNVERLRAEIKRLRNERDAANIVTRGHLVAALAHISDALTSLNDPPSQPRLAPDSIAVIPDECRAPLDERTTLELHHDESSKRRSPMDDLGNRIVADKAQVAFNRSRAEELERQARALKRDADEIERLLELARRQS